MFKEASYVIGAVQGLHLFKICMSKIKGSPCFLESVRFCHNDAFFSKTFFQRLLTW